MKHVVVDRPRTGGDGGKSKPPKGSKKQFNKTPLEEQPKFQSSSRKRVYGYNCKELSDHLGPLRRWLRSQVGRNWDDVWSEICENLSVHDVMTRHVREHAEYYVQKNCTIDEEGDVCDSKGLKLIGDWRSRDFYVDPCDNTLKVVKSMPRWRPKKRIKKWFEGKDEWHRYYLLNDIWYEVELKNFPKINSKRFSHRNEVYVHDVVMEANWERGNKKYGGSCKRDCVNCHGSEIYAANKRQISKRDIRRLKLRERYEKLIN